jgi:hypothetical protein
MMIPLIIVVSKDTEWLLVQNDDDYKSLHNNNDREMYVLSEMSHVLDRCTLHGNNDDALYVIMRRIIVV